MFPPGASAPRPSTPRTTPRPASTSSPADARSPTSNSSASPVTVPAAARPERGFVDNHLKPPITADPADDRGVIELRIVQWGERTVKVDPGEFEKAVTDGALDNYLDVDVSNMDHHTG